MIKSLKVEKLFGRYDFDLDFFEDVNIITGSNGVGKTTLLKLMWYMVSGNLRQALKEIPFSRVEMVIGNLNIGGMEVILVKRASSPTDKRSDGSQMAEGDEVAEIHIKAVGKEETLTSYPSISMSNIDHELGGTALIITRQTFFFPTFRRFGTGFNLDKTNLSAVAKEIVAQVSHSKSHVMVTSANQDDIAMAYSKKRNDISNKAETIDWRMKADLKSLASSKSPSMAKEIEELLGKYQKMTDTLQAPVRKLTELVDYLYLDKSIEITNGVLIGTHPRKISVEQLSSGEEMMLSYLCYNMAYDNAIFFIDEPELYFHPDWQRLIMGILREQNPSNTFIVVTHSPGVATSMPTRLIRLDRILRTQIPEAFDVPEQR